MLFGGGGILMTSYIIYLLNSSDWRASNAKISCFCLQKLSKIIKQQPKIFQNNEFFFLKDFPISAKYIENWTFFKYLLRFLFHFFRMSLIRKKIVLKIKKKSWNWNMLVSHNLFIKFFNFTKFFASRAY